VLPKTEIGLLPITWEIELFLFTMLNMKKFLNQPIDSVLIILILKFLMSINKLTKTGIASKDIGIISTSVIVMILTLPLVT
jgi:hypothetical protein